jgi:hypothetical protein
MVGERMSGKEFGENKKFKMAARSSYSMKNDHKVDPRYFFPNIVKMTHLPLQHYGDCRMSPIVSILSEHVA